MFKKTDIEEVPSTPIPDMNFFKKVEYRKSAWISVLLYMFLKGKNKTKQKKKKSFG